MKIGDMELTPKSEAVARNLRDGNTFQEFAFERSLESELVLGFYVVREGLRRGQAVVNITRLSIAPGFGPQKENGTGISLVFDRDGDLSEVNDIPRQDGALTLRSKVARAIFGNPNEATPEALATKTEDVLREVERSRTLEPDGMILMAELISSSRQR